MPERVHDHVPGALGGLAGLKVAQVDRQVGVGQRGIVDPRAKELGDEEQILLVLDDLRLLRLNHHAVGHPVADVLHQHAEGKRNGAALAGDRINPDDIARL